VRRSFGPRAGRTVTRDVTVNRSRIVRGDGSAVQAEPARVGRPSADDHDVGPTGHRRHPAAPSGRACIDRDALSSPVQRVVINAGAADLRRLAHHPVAVSAARVLDLDYLSADGAQEKARGRPGYMGGEVGHLDRREASVWKRHISPSEAYRWRL
jgi:hypothetical protein